MKIDTNIYNFIDKITIKHLNNYTLKILVLHRYGLEISVKSPAILFCIGSNLPVIIIMIMI